MSNAKLIAPVLGSALESWLHVPVKVMSTSRSVRDMPTEGRTSVLILPYGSKSDYEGTNKLDTRYVGGRLVIGWLSFGGVPDYANDGLLTLGWAIQRRYMPDGSDGLYLHLSKDGDDRRRGSLITTQFSVRLTNHVETERKAA